MTPKPTNHQIPQLLREIPQPPKELYVRGVLPSHDDYAFLTVVGSRKYTTYGADVCRELIRGLAGYPVVIVSGLALGIDTIAHEAALTYGLTTVAIPGSGLSDEVLYPASNAGLALDIIAAGGALLSEYEPNFKATNWSFPKRNRLMAGIAHATLVIECDIKSGTMITARMATDYNRDVLAVPGSIFSETSNGTNMLIRMGATPITSARDILEALHIEPRTETASEHDAETLLASDDERTVYAILAEPCDRHEVIRRSGLPAFKATIVLSSLELKGLIKESGGMVRRT